MKIIKIVTILIISILLSINHSNAQCNIPNPDFENWGTTYPVDWTPIHPSDSNAIFQTPDSYSGNYAVKFDTASSFIGLKSAAYICTEKPANLQGYYKMTGNDSLIVYVTLTDALINTIASGVKVVASPSPDYTKFNVLLEYDTTATPVYGFINIISTGHGTIYVDDLSFNGTILTPVTDSIPMRDFKNLAADIYLPNTTDTFPTILIQTPYYRKVYRSLGLPLNIDFAVSLSNYAFVIADWRCFYGSTDACVPNVTIQKKGEDGYDIIDWIVNQSWSDGQVGTYGGSAVGKIQYYTAREQHPAHICAVPKVTGTTTNYTTYFSGGALKLEYLNTIDALGYNASMILGVDSNRFYNNYWEFAEDYGFFPEEIKTKMFLIGGWYDHNTEDVLELFDSLRTYSDPPVRDKHRLMFGPWTHGGYTTSGVGDAMQGNINYQEAENYDDSLALKFFDYYLRNQNNGWDNFPDIKYFQMGENNWYNTLNWQPDSINDVIFYLNANGTIDNNLPANTTDELSYLYNPIDPSPTWGGSTMRFDLLQGPFDQSFMVENRNDILIFSTPVLSQDVILKGNVKVNLFVSSDRFDTDFTVRLTDVYPNGKSMILTDGIQRMRFRNGYTVNDTAMMTPGQIYPITIELPNTAITFLAGHQIRIDITSSNYPKYNRNMNTGGDMYPNHNGDTLVNPLIATNAVYLNSIYPSNIVLPLKNYSTGIHINQLNNEFDIIIYPNPTTGIFTIEGEDIKLVEIINITGQTVKQFIIDNYQSSIDLNNQPKGIYLIKVTTDKGITAGKVVLE